MFSMNLIGINTILGLAGLLFAFTAALMALLVSRSNSRLRLRCEAVESSLAATRRELELLSSISLKTGRRVKRFEREYAGVTDRVALVELRGSTQSFDQAIDSARRGTDPGRLTEQFGLSRGEADLVTRLHGRRKKTA
jgi:hypothetical protein